MYLAGMLAIALVIARLPFWPGGGESPAGTPAPTASPGGFFPTPRPPTPTPPTDAKSKAAIAEGQLVWWHSFDDYAGRQLLGAFNRHYPHILVTGSQTLPLSQLYPSLVADLKATTSAVDVVLLTDIEPAWDLQQRGWLAEYASPNASGIGQVYKSQPAGFWTIVECDPVGVVWNARAISATTVITGYAQLAKPEWRGLLALTEAAGESQMAWGYEVEGAAGWDYLDLLAKNKPLIFGSADRMLTQLSTGRFPVALNAPWSIARRYLGTDKDLKLLQPPEGVPARCSAVALLASAPHPNAGKVFIDFLLSQEGQRLLSSSRGIYPVRSDGGAPSGLPAPGSYPMILPSTWNDYGKAGRDFPARWERAFGSLK